jgi:hypothetical protein
LSNKLLWKAVLLLPIILPAAAAGQVFNAPLIIQEQNEWCWAGVSSAILQYYGHPQNQCTIAEYTRTVATWHNFGTVNCCNNPNLGCNYWNYNWGYAGSIQDILMHWGVNNYGIGAALGIAQIQTEIAAGRPFIIRWAWSSGGGHFLVGHGILDSTLYYMNPWPGEGLKIGDHSWVVSDGSTHTWTHTTKITTPAPRVAFTGLALSLSTEGTARAETVASNEPTQAGYAKLAVNSGTAPYATAVFRFMQDGVTVTEAGVPASPPTTRARVFIDYRADVNAVPGRSEAGTVDINTGVAVVNNGTAPANVTYVLRDLTGGILASGNGTIAAGNYFAKFIDNLSDVAPDFNLPSNFQTAIQFGSLQITSTQPLSVLALRGTMNQRNEFLITTTPVADLTQALGNGSMYFPQFADGGGYTTSLILMNTSTQIETGSLVIRDKDGNPLSVNWVGGSAASSIPYSIPSGGVQRFQTDGFPVETKAGWVQLTPDTGTAAPTGSGVFGFNPDKVLVSESGIPAVAATTHARVYVDLSENHNTGLAIANVSSTSSSIVVNAFQKDGVTAAGISKQLDPLPANGYTASFADGFVTGLSAGFTGVLDITGGAFAALTLRSLNNERGDFLMTTFPVADVNKAAPSPIVFPQIADGGGYMTQFILISAGGSSSMVMNFYGANGEPLAVGK